MKNYKVSEILRMLIKDGWYLSIHRMEATGNSNTLTKKER
jgi:hypothetical protein